MITLVEDGTEIVTLSQVHDYSWEFNFKRAETQRNSASYKVTKNRINDTLYFIDSLRRDQNTSIVLRKMNNEVLEKIESIVSREELLKIFKNTKISKIIIRINIKQTNKKGYILTIERMVKLGGAVSRFSFCKDGEKVIGLNNYFCSISTIIFDKLEKKKSKNDGRFIYFNNKIVLVPANEYKLK